MRIIAGEARGRQIEAPAGKHTRPTLDRVRENMFNILQGEIRGCRVLDLFAGSGALSLESLSRGADSAVLVDSDRNAVAVQRRNIDKLNYTDRTRQLHCDWQKAVRQLESENAVFDLVFLDPPYIMTDLRTLFRMLTPVITRDTLVVLEHEAGKEIMVSGEFEQIKQRAWGFCAMSIYRLLREGE